MKKICKYLIISFAVTYLFWGIDIILSCLGLYEHPGYNFGIVFYIIAACSPAIAVFIIWQRDSEKKGIRYFVKTIIRLSNPVIELSLLIIFLQRKENTFSEQNRCVRKYNLIIFD